ncbi:hypothetical protein AAVH_17623 [Aphelenchoides avenae]|nr:hypothetical protein AAVH_17623 [Aphelenchus avenae]
MSEMVADALTLAVDEKLRQNRPEEHKPQFTRKQDALMDFDEAAKKLKAELGREPAVPGTAGMRQFKGDRWVEVSGEPTSLEVPASDAAYASPGDSFTQGETPPATQDKLHPVVDTVRRDAMKWHDVPEYIKVYADTASDKVGDFLEHAKDSVVGASKKVVGKAEEAKHAVSAGKDEKNEDYDRLGWESSGWLRKP